MPEPLQELQRQLLKHAGGDRVMAQVLTAVPLQGLEAVLVAVELALQAGHVSGEHVVNLLARLKERRPPTEPVYSAMELTTPSEPDVHRYDRLRAAREDGHV